MVTQHNSVDELVSSLQKIEDKKRDYIVPFSNIEMVSSNEIAFRETENSAAFYDVFGMNDIAHGQLADRLGIPRAYYSAIQNIGDLRAYNVNALLRDRAESKFTMRTFDEPDGNIVRAMLSDRYLPVDNAAIFMEMMPVLREFSGVEIKSSAITDSRLYLQLVFNHTTREVKKGDAVQFGVTLTNSEVGMGAVKIESTVWRLVCSNGMVGESIVDRKHVGRRIDAGEDMELFRRETVQADVKAFTMKMADMLRHSLKDAEIERIFNPIREAAGIPVEKPEETVENITRKYNLRESESRNILRNMFSDGNYTRWGVVNGITNTARITESHDRQYELEKIGNDVLHMPSRDWNTKIGA